MEEKSLSVVESSELIRLKQLPIIEDRLDEARESVSERLSAMSGLVATEENYKEVKKVRADLKRERDELETMRKQIKKALEEPYKQFEQGAYKRLVDLYDEAISCVDTSVKEVEGSLILQRKEELRKYFDEYRISLGLEEDLADARRSGIKVGLSGTMKSLKQQAKDFLDKIDSDLKAIETMENRDEVLVAYRDSLNVADAVRVVNEYHRRLEEEQKRREEMEAARKAKEEHDAVIDSILSETTQNGSESVSQESNDVIAPPSVKVAVEQTDGNTEQVLSTVYLGYKVFGTLSQLKGLKEALKEALKNYCDSEGLNYGEC